MFVGKRRLVVITGVTRGLGRAMLDRFDEAGWTVAAVALDPGGGGSIDTAMLRACAPEEVDSSPTPEEWSRTAVPFILSLGPRDNGKSLTCPRP